jgi:hypothetical protein
MATILVMFTILGFALAVDEVGGPCDAKGIARKKK